MQEATLVLGNGFFFRIPSDLGYAISLDGSVDKVQVHFQKMMILG